MNAVAELPSEAAAAAIWRPGPTAAGQPHATTRPSSTSGANMRGVRTTESGNTVFMAAGARRCPAVVGVLNGGAGQVCGAMGAGGQWRVCGGGVLDGWSVAVKRSVLPWRRVRNTRPAWRPVLGNEPEGARGCSAADPRRSEWSAGLSLWLSLGIAPPSTLCVQSPPLVSSVPSLRGHPAPNAPSEMNTSRTTSAS